MEDYLLPENMSIASGEYQIANNEYKIANDLTTQKSIELSNSLLAKRQAVLGITNQDPSKWEVIDGDTIKDISGNTVRLDPLMGGLSLDTYETNHGTKWEQDPLNQAKLLKQRLALTDFKNKDSWFPWTKTNLDEVTNQDVYKQGELAKQKLKDTLLGLNNVELNQFKFEKADSRNKGDVRTVGDINNEAKQSLLDALNTPEFNAAYDTKYNAAKNTLDNTSLSEDVSDAATLLRMGGVGIGQVAGYAVEKSGLSEDEGKFIQASMSDETKRLASNLSPAMQKAMLEPLINESPEDASTFDKWTNFNKDFGVRSLEAAVLESLPGTVAMGATGMPIAKGLGLAADAVLGTTGARVAANAGFNVTGNIGKKLAVSDVLSSGLGFGTSEGVFSGAQNASQWGEEARTKPIEEFKNTPLWDKTLAENNGDVDKTKEDLINLGQSKIMLKTALTTGLISAVTGGGMYGGLGKVSKDAFITGVLKEAGLEGFQEAPQSYFENKTTNEATQEFVNTAQNIDEGNINAAVLGAASGMVMGGGMHTATQAPQAAVSALKSALNARREAKQEEAVQAAKSQAKMDSEAIKTVTDETDPSKLNQYITNIIGSKISPDVQLDVIEQFKTKASNEYETRKNELQPEIDKLYQQSITKDDPNLIEDNIHTSKLSPKATESIQAINYEANKITSEDPDVVASLNPKLILEHADRIANEASKVDLKDTTIKEEYRNAVNKSINGYWVIANATGKVTPELFESHKAKVIDVLQNLEDSVVNNTDMTNKKDIAFLIKSNYGSVAPEGLTPKGEKSIPTEDLEEASKSKDKVKAARAKTTLKLRTIYTKLEYKLRRIPGAFKQVAKEVFEGTGSKPAIKEHQAMVMTAIDSNSHVATVASLGNFSNWIGYHSEKQQELAKVHKVINKKGVTKDEITKAVDELNKWAEQEHVKTIEGEVREYYADNKDQFNNLYEQVTDEAKAMQIAFHALREEAGVLWDKKDLPDTSKHLLDTEVVTPETGITEKVKPEVDGPAKDITETLTDEVIPTEESKPKETKINDAISKESTQPEQDTLQDEVVNKRKVLNIAGKTIKFYFSDMKGKLAGTDRFKNIKINPNVTRDSFFKYFTGNIDIPNVTSKQKQAILPLLAKEGFTLDVIKAILSTDKLVKTFLILHENSHVEHNDSEVYFTNEERLLPKDKRDYLSANKLTIETRASVEALNLILQDLSKTLKDFTIEEDFDTSEIYDYGDIPLPDESYFEGYDTYEIEDTTQVTDVEAAREEANNKFLEWQANKLNTLTPMPEVEEAINYSILKPIKVLNKAISYVLFNNLIPTYVSKYYGKVIALLKDSAKETVFTKYPDLFRNLENNKFIIEKLKSIEGKVAIDTIAEFVEQFHNEYVKANTKVSDIVDKTALTKKINSLKTNPVLQKQLITYLQKNKDNEINREQALKDFTNNIDAINLIKQYSKVLLNVEQNPSLLLHNDTDEVVDRNITAQLALHALSWMINTGTKTLYTEREMILHMLNKEEATAPSDEAMAALSTMGLVRGYVANQVAGSIVNYFGFKPNDSIPKEMFPKFETALGLSAVDTLERMGYVEYKGIPQASMNAFMTGEDTVGFNYTSESEVLDKATIFVRIKSDLTKNNEPILDKHVRELFDKVKPGNKEIQEIFNIELVETEYSATPWEKSKLLKMLGEKDGILTFGNSRTQYAKDDRRAVLNGARSAFDNRTAANDLANKLGDEHLKEINFEKKLDAEDHIGNFESNKGLLSSTVSMLDSWKELNNLGEVVYFYYKKMYQGRYQGVGSGHPQTNKLVRWTRSLWKGEVKKNYSNPVFKQFMQAVIEGFGKKPSQMTDAEIQASFTEIYEKHIPVLELINQDTLTEEEKDTIVQTIHAGGEKYHTMAVLAALSEYHFAVGDTFTTTLMREIDGITNGPLISLIMMSGVGRNTDPNLLKAGGVNVDGNSYLDFIQNNELNDVYKIIANQIDWFKSSLSHELESNINFGRNPRLESNVPLQQRIAIMDAYPNRIEPQIWVNAIHNLVGIIDRGFAKNPTTVFIFGGSTIKIAANVASKVLFDINNKLLAISKIEDEIQQLDAVKELHANLFNSIGLPINLLTEYTKASNKKTFLLNWQLSKSEKSILRNSVIAIYTPVIDNAVKTVFTRLLENRRLINNVYQLTNKIFKHEFERKVDELVKQGITITAEDIDNILLELQPLMPDIAIYNAEDTPEQRLQLWKEEAAKQGKPNYRVKISSPKESKSMTMMGLDEKGDVFESYIVDGIKIHVPQSASAYAKDMIIAAMSVRAPITSTHNADSHGIQQLLIKFKQVLGIHDAAMMGLDKVEDVSKGMNEALFNLLSNYNYFNEVYKHLERVKSYGKNIDSWFAGTIDIVKAKKEGLFNNEVSTEASAVDISKEIVGSWNTRWSKNPETGRNEQIIIFTSFNRFLNFFKDKSETLYKELQENVIIPIKQGGSFGNYSGQYPFVPKYIPTGTQEEQIVSIIESGLNQDNTNTKPEDKPNEYTSTGFLGYISGFDSKGKGTKEGDGKDKAMRKVAIGFVGEVVNAENDNAESSTDTSANEIANKVNGYVSAEGNNTLTVVHGTNIGTIMLARNGKLANKELTSETKKVIKQLHQEGYDFVVGDMPNVDTQFINYLQELGATFSIYHTDNESRIKINTNLGSQESTTTNLFEPINSLGNIDSTNVLNTAERLESLGNVPNSDEHTTHLKSILGGFISKVLQPLQYFEMTSPEANIGEFNPTLQAIGLNISNAPIAPTVKVPMSALTTFVHELVHSVTANALFDPKNSILRSRVQKIFNHIERNISDTDKEKYSHIFANKNRSTLDNGTIVNHGLAELIAFAETEPMFRELLNSLPKMTVGKITETYDEAKKQFVEATLLEIISNIFSKIMIWWNDKIKGEHSTDVITQLHTLTVQLSTAHIKAKSTLLDFKVVTDKSDQMVINKLHDLLLKPLNKLLGNNYFTLNKNSRIRSISKLGTDMLDDTLSSKMKVNALFKGIEQVKRLNKVSENHWLTYSLNEITGQLSVGNYTNALNMTKKLRDKVVASITHSISSNLRNGFKTNLTRELERVIYNTVLKLDLSAIQDYYKDKFMDMLDLNKRNDEITRLEKFVIKNPNGNLYLGHIYNTAHFMITNQATESFKHSTLRNATQIYNLYGSDIKPTKGTEHLIEIIDKLIHLNALNIVNQEELNILKNLFNIDEHGLNMTMEVHRQQKEHHLNSILLGNKSLVELGSTKELTNPNRQIIIATGAEESKLKLQHYTKGDKVPYGTEDLYIYHSKYKFMMPWVQGIISYTAMNNVFSDMKGVMKQSDGLNQIIQDDKLNDKHRLETIAENKRNATNKHFDTNVATYTLNPEFNKNGKINKHSFMISNKDKENLLDMNTNFTHVLGAMVANITDKLNTQKLNAESLEILINDRRNNLKDKSIEWITLSATAPTKNERDIWKKLPLEFKALVKDKTGFDEITVNAKLLKMIFGQRKLSITDFIRPADEHELNKFVKYIGSQLYPYMSKVNLRRWESLWQEGIGYVKDQLVVKSGSVLVGNEISNFWIAYLEGMTAKEYISAKSKALKLVIDYHKITQQIADIEYLLAYDKTLTSIAEKNLKDKLSNLTTARNTSLIYKYESAGQMKTIIEEVDIDENLWSFRNETWDKLFKDKFDKIPKPIAKVGKELFMTHDTKMYQLMKDLTQMSDLTSRIAVAEFKQSHGMTEKDALQLVDEAFINYDIPSHENIQYAADMGLFMFNKFFFRIQSVIAREIGQHPARFLTLLGLEQVFGAQEAIHHSLMTPGTILGHVNDPITTPFAILDSNFYKWLFSFHAPEFQSV